MLVVFPLSPEATIRRIPLITIAIISFTLLSFLFTYPRMIKEEREIEEAYRELFEFEKKILSRDILPPDRERIEILKERIKRIEDNMLIRKAFIPSKITLRGILLTPLLHAGFLHLFFNLYFLYLVGCNIEDDWGRPLFLLLYILSNIFACLFYAFLKPYSSIPVIGASGAISGIMGAFTLRHWNTKIRLFVGVFPFLRFFGTIIKLPAWIVFSGWFIQQVIGAMKGEGGVAFLSHIGGFLFGLFSGIIMKITRTEERILAPRIEDRIDIVPYRFREAVEELERGDEKGFEEKMKRFLDENPFYPDGWKILFEHYRKKGEDVGRYIKELVSRARIENNKKILCEIYPFIKDEISSLPPSDVIYISDALWEHDRGWAIEFLERSYKKCKIGKRVLILLKLIRRMKEEGMDTGNYIKELEEKFPSYRRYV